MTESSRDVGEAYNNLVGSLNEADNKVKEITAERNAIAMDLLQLQRARAPTETTRLHLSESPAAESRRTAKLADPPQLEDSVEVQYEAWETQMKLKIAANADHFTTPAMRIAYVSSRCTGEAYKHLATRLRDSASIPYDDDNDVFDHLREVYADPNRLENAQYEFHELKMKTSDKY